MWKFYPPRNKLRSLADSFLANQHMKKILLPLLLLLGLAGCRSRTEFGECIGIAESQDKTLVYRFDAGNIVLACVFSETIFVPIIVVVDELQCPVGIKKKPQP